MALIFVRHGSTQLNAGDPSDPKEFFRGWIDAPLSDFGQKTVAQTAAYMGKIPVKAIVSSDMTRAQQTAQAISQTTGAPVLTDPRLRPMHIGVLTGKPIDDEGKKMMEVSHQNPDMPIPGGESYNDFVNRFKSALPELLKAAKDQNIVVVTHHRNLLALPHIFFNAKPEMKGPPTPGGVVVLRQNGVQRLFEPPAEEAVKEKAAS